jgi:hypothetical protein
MKKENLKFKIILSLIFSLAIIFISYNNASAERIFQKDSTWYTPIPANAKLDSKSDYYKQYLIDHTNSFGTEYREWSIPVYYADASIPLRTVTTESGAYSWQVPIADGWRSAGEDDICAGKIRDGYMLIIDKPRGKVWTFRKMYKCSGGLPANGDNWTANLGRWDYISGDGIYRCGSLNTGEGNCAIRVSGTNLAHGLIFYNDIVTAKKISHALAYAGPQTRISSYGCLHNYPSPENQPSVRCCGMQCGADKGYNESVNVPQLGSRFQLEPSFDCTQYAANTMLRIMCDAFKTYGAIYAIHSGEGTSAFSGEDLEWDKSRSWSPVLQSPPLEWYNYIRFVLPVCIGQECSDVGAICSGSNQNFNCLSVDTTPPSPPANVRVN